MKKGSSVLQREFSKKSRIAFAALMLASGLVATACGNASNSATGGSSGSNSSGSSSGSSNSSTGNSGSSNSSAGSSGSSNSATGNSSSSNAASGGTATSKQPSGTPIKIGVSVSMSGNFSNDGKAIKDGYTVWANEVNAQGGLLGRPVQLTFLNDASSTSQVVTNYQTLINVDHVDLVFGPFSSLLTLPAATIANRYGYAFAEPAGGAPSVFAAKLPNLAFVQTTPIVDNLQSFCKWILSLPASKRPKTAAFATSDDPFTQPQLVTARQTLEKAGIKTVYFHVYPSKTTDYAPIADGIINSKADIVLLGTQENDAYSFIKLFAQQHYNPKALIETGGPDAGSQFSNAVGMNNTEGVMVPGTWVVSANTYNNQEFVQDYVKTFGGTKADIPTSAAQAYAVAQVVQQAVEKTNSLNNQKIIQAFHSMQFNTVEGPLKFNKLGEPDGVTFLEQWQNGTAIPVYPPQFATASPEYPKKNWGS